MLWILTSLFFCWLIFREFRNRWTVRAGYDGPDPTPLSKPYLAALLALALLFAWPPFRYWRTERLLSAKATELAEFHRAKVHCNTIFDTLFDSESLASGHANPRTGEIVFQYPWCERFIAYLDHPERADRAEIVSLDILTHESMHVRGEYNEAITECEAVQRNYRTARMLGVPDAVARRNALDYYQNVYMLKGQIGGMQAAYFSNECAPGKAMDEHLADSTWPTQ
jgi:hypothetical protein